MPINHYLLALLVVIVWGLNYLFVKIGLDEISPLLLCGLRFFFASIPAIFFIKRPPVPFRWIASYGLIMFGLQFALLFVGMKVGMMPGMASIVMQVQVFFSMFFAAILLAEVPSIWQMLGAFISFAGIGLLALHVDRHVSVLGLVLILLAAATWGIGNLITKYIRNRADINMMGLVVWGSFAACLPMFLLSLVIEGPHCLIESYHHLTWKGIMAVFYIVYGSTWVGYGVWNALLGRYPVATVAPFNLLVPIVSIISSVLLLGEPFQTWKIHAGLLVMLGLCINLFGAHLFWPLKFLLKRKRSVSA